MFSALGLTLVQAGRPMASDAPVASADPQPTGFVRHPAEHAHVPSDLGLVFWRV